MEISVEQPKGNVRRIVLDGRLDVPGTQSVEAKFNAAVGGSSNVVVDLGKVPFVASVGIRMLVAGAQTVSKAGGHVVFVSPDEMTRKILKTTGIDQLVKVYGDLDSALASF